MPSPKTSENKNEKLLNDLTKQVNGLEDRVKTLELQNDVLIDALKHRDQQPAGHAFPNRMPRYVR